jgi:hypothetical protein
VACMGEEMHIVLARKPARNRPLGGRQRREDIKIDLTNSMTRTCTDSSGSA